MEHNIQENKIRRPWAFFGFAISLVGIVLCFFSLFFGFSFWMLFLLVLNAICMIYHLWVIWTGGIFSYEAEERHKEMLKRIKEMEDVLEQSN